MILLVFLFAFAVVALFVGTLLTLADYAFEGTLWWEPVRRMRRERDHAVQKRAHELEGQGFDQFTAKVQATNEVYGMLRNATRVP